MELASRPFCAIPFLGKASVQRDVLGSLKLKSFLKAPVSSS